MSKRKRKILVVCSRNKKRSPTAERIFHGHPEVEVRSAGTSPNATHQISHKDIAWADVILCMETKHTEQITRLFGQNNVPPLVVAEIEDVYEYMDPELCEMLEYEIMRLVR